MGVGSEAIHALSKANARFRNVKMASYDGRGEGRKRGRAGSLKKARIDQRPVDQGWDDDDIVVAKIRHLGYQNVEKVWMLL
jgi:hypothetical protein